MKKVLFLAMVIAIVVASLPASAAYKYNWATNFEVSSAVPTIQGGYTSNAPGPNLSPLPVGTPGQKDWRVADNPSYTDEKSLVVTKAAGLAGTQGLVEPGPHAANYKPMSALNGTGANYYRGYAKFWVYDPGFTGSTGGADGRVGVYGQNGENNIGKMATAQIQDASTRNPNYWYAQWSYSVGIMDGATVVAAGSDAGGSWTFTQGLAAPRVWGAWSYVMINWSFTYNIPRKPSSGGTGTIKYYINQATVQPNLTLNMVITNPTTGRYANFNQVKGIFAGSGMTTVANGKPVAYDNFEFHADAVPEPSSLLALGTGLFGLMGLIRRRK